MQSLVVHHGSKLSVFHQNVHAQDCIVRHNHGRRDLRTSRHREAEPRTEPVPPPMWHHMQSTPTNVLAGAIVCFLVRSEGGQRSSFADGVVATCGIVGGVFLSQEQFLKVRELLVRASAHFLHRWLKIDEDRAAHTFLRQFPRRKC